MLLNSYFFPMVIDGRALAQKILDSLKKEIKRRRLKPHLAIVLMGEDLVWRVYVGQKVKKAAEIGAKTTTHQLPSLATTEELLNLLNDLNHLSKVHGIIIQRPLPPQIDRGALALAVDPKKDVDGFHPKSKFPMPVAEAVMEILKEIYRLTRLNLVKVKPRQGGTSLRGWLANQNIIVIGKGETAGRPIFVALKKLGALPKVIDTRTHNPKLITKKADIIISCVGKADVVGPEMVKNGVVLIGVGLHRDSKGKLAGDYEEEKIKDIASFYTPIPGGVGPVNVACLLENLVQATKMAVES